VLGCMIPPQEIEARNQKDVSLLFPYHSNI